MTAAFLRRALAILATLANATAASALDCHRAQTRLEQVICTAPALREPEAALDQAFAEALKRFAGHDRDVRAAQEAWLADRNAACATSDRRVLEQCIGAQDRLRLPVLTALAPRSAPPAAAAPTTARATPAAASAPADALRPGSYLSEAVEFVLQADGGFTLRELGGSRQASGHYQVADGVLTLTDASGDVGRTAFPLRCRILRTANGFAVTLGQPQCRPFDGLSFRLAS